MTTRDDPLRPHQTTSASRPALVMFDTRTLPVQSATASENVTVANRKIIYSRFLFDRAPFIALLTLRPIELNVRGGVSRLEVCAR
jgi:hypothetical protein